MLGEHERLTPRQVRFAHALVASRTIREACQRVGVGEATARRWLKQPALQRLVAELAHEQLAGLTSRFRQLGLEAAETLAEAMAASDAPWASRIRASEVVLSHLLKLVELTELERRLQAVEQRLREVRDAGLGTADTVD